MNPLSIISCVKFAGIAILIGILGYVAWDIKSTYNKNDELTKEVAVHKSSIEALKDDIKTQKDLNNSLVIRKQQLELIEQEYVAFLESNKKSNKKFIDNSKKEIAKVKETTPNELDNYYTNAYNDILGCISDTTANKETKCDTP